MFSTVFSRLVSLLMMTSTILGAGVLFTTDAKASDGVLEISQACVATGCFPGDAPGFPVTITSGGSYRMTSSLTQTVIGVGGSVENAIEIERSFVRIDLNGFFISCNAILSGSCSGSASGIAVTGGTLQAPLEELAIENGTVAGMPGHGVSLNVGGAVIRNVSAVNNGGDGISTETLLDSGSLVESCISRGNGGDGIKVGLHGLVKGSVSIANGGFSIASLTPIFGGPSGSGYTECVTSGPTSGIADLGSNS